jgi:hypothetical protein
LCFLLVLQNFSNTFNGPLFVFGSCRDKSGAVVQVRKTFVRKTFVRTFENEFSHCSTIRPVQRLHG